MAANEVGLLLEGQTLKHVIGCLPDYTSPPVSINAASLWTAPLEVARQLAAAETIVKNTRAGKRFQQAAALRSTPRGPRLEV